MSVMSETVPAAPHAAVTAVAGGPFLRNTWYVAAWSHELPPGALLARTIAGEALVLWRTASGSIAALEDRCCHRQAPLSCGRVEADGLRCGYHGLKFAPDGRCIEVPGLDRVPPAARVRRYAVVEHRRWVMVWLGDVDAADPTRLPDNHACDSPDWRYRPGYLHYDTPVELIADNLLDFSHLSYVHAGTLGGSDRIAAIRPTVQDLPDGVRVERHVPAVPPPAYYRPLWPYDGLIDRWIRYDFLLPGVLLMDSGAQPAGMTPEEAAERGVGVRFHSCQAITPETATSTHYFFMEAHRADRGDETVTEGLYQGLLAAFAEDRAMITAQWHNLQRTPGRPMLPLAMDAALVRYRACLAQALAREGR